MTAESVASRASGLAFVKRKDNSGRVYTLVSMKGAVAAGHPLTAEAGAEVLENGGNAVDACIAAALVSWVAESTLTGPGRAASCCFTARTTARLASSITSSRFPASACPTERSARWTPSRSRSHPSRSRPSTSARPRARCRERPLGSGRRTGASGRCRGRTCSTRRSRSRAKRRRPHKPQAYLHAVQDPILRHTEESSAIYGPAGRRLEAGERVMMTDLGGDARATGRARTRTTLPRRARPRISGYLREHGGAVTERDLDEYRVVQRRPVRDPVPRSRVRVEPAAVGRGRPDRARDRPARPGRIAGSPGSAESMAQLVEVMRAQEAARAAGLRPACTAAASRGGCTPTPASPSRGAPCAPSAGVGARDHAHLGGRRPRATRPR